MQRPGVQGEGEGRPALLCRTGTGTSHRCGPDTGTALHCTALHCTGSSIVVAQHLPFHPPSTQSH
jgi:hypothetical protein